MREYLTAQASLQQLVCNSAFTHSSMHNELQLDVATRKVQDARADLERCVNFYIEFHKCTAELNEDGHRDENGHLKPRVSLASPNCINCTQEQSPCQTGCRDADNQAIPALAMGHPQADAEKWPISFVTTGTSTAIINSFV